MFGTASGAMKLDQMKEVVPQQYAAVMSLADRAVREAKRSQRLELLISQEGIHLVQKGEATLSPLVHLEAINDLVAKGIISEEEAIRERARIQIKSKIKLYKIRPEASLELIAQGMPGAPGAIFGRIALGADQVLQMSERDENVILISTEPQDENIYLLALGRIVKGIIASYGIGRGSHIVDFADSSGIPMISSVRDIEFKENNVRIGEKVFSAGDEVVIDGGSGKIYVSSDAEPVVEDRTMVSLSYGVNYLELMRSMRIRFEAYSYEEILAEHATGTREVRGLRMKADREEIAMLQARVHCLHLLAYEKGNALGKNRLKVDLDVAVANGNMNRLSGLEDREFFIVEEKEEFIIITGTEQYMDFFGYMGIGITDVGDIISAASEMDLGLRSYYGQRKLTIHTQSITSFGLRFPKPQLEKVIGFLKEYFKNR
jgi:hypothetical protein